MVFLKKIPEVSQIYTTGINRKSGRWSNVQLLSIALFSLGEIPWKSIYKLQTFCKHEEQRTLPYKGRTPVRKHETGNDISVNMHYDRQTDIGTQTRIHTYAFAYVYLCSCVSVSVAFLGKHETSLCHLSPWQLWRARYFYTCNHRPTTPWGGYSLPRFQ